jgi:hypothetical protein
MEDKQTGYFTHDAKFDSKLQKYAANSERKTERIL